MAIGRLTALVRVLLRRAQRAPLESVQCQPMEMYRAEIGSDVAYGLTLVGLNRVGVEAVAYLESIERLLASIDDHPHTRLVLQTSVSPAPAAPYQGRTAVHLFIVGSPERADHLVELVDDLVDLLDTAPPMVVRADRR